MSSIRPFPFVSLHPSLVCRPPINLFSSHLFVFCSMTEDIAQVDSSRITSRKESWGREVRRRVEKEEGMEFGIR